MRLPDITLVTGLFRTSARKLGNQVRSQRTDADGLEPYGDVVAVPIVSPIFHSPIDSDGAQQDHA